MSGDQFVVIEGEEVLVRDIVCEDELEIHDNIFLVMVVVMSQ